MSTKLARPLKFCLEYVDKLPDDVLPVFVDDRLCRASELKPGDKIVDCSFRLATVREVEWEIAEYVILETEEEEAEFDALFEKADEIAWAAYFRNCKKSYKINDITVYDTDDHVHSFVNCCHFEEEHADTYPEIELA